eukprot:IDg9817t1
MATAPNAPTGTRWPMIKELLVDILADVRGPPIRDFLLREQPRDEAHALLSPQLLVRSFAYTTRYTTRLENKTALDERAVGFFLPHGTIVDGDVSLGLYVDAFAHNAPANLSFTRRSRRTHRAAVNHRTHSGISLSYDHAAGAVDLTFSRQSNGRFQYIILLFDQALFKNAFTADDTMFDLTQLELALRSSVMCDAFPVHTPGNRATSDVCPLHVMLGGFNCTNVITKYDCGEPSFSASVLSCGNITFGAQFSLISKMASWAVRERLSLLSPTPKYAIQESEQD